MAGYTLLGTLGWGGHATVYSGRDEAGRDVAIKVGHAAGPRVRARFAREARAMARVGVPHVPDLIGRGELDSGAPYLVMERLFGRTLAEAMASTREPDLESALQLSCRLLDALDRVHRAGLVHRDLKPENVFVCPEGQRIALLDFGLVDAEDERVEITRSGEIAGTAEYMAPEQLRAEACDPRTDLYAFGVILYELLTLRPPFVGDRASVEHGHLALRPLPPSRFAVLPEQLEAVILSCLAKDAEQRPADAVSLRAALEGAGAVPARDISAVAPSSPMRTAIRTEGRRPVVLVAARWPQNGDVRIAELASQFGGEIAGHADGCDLIAFPGTRERDPVVAALELAAALADRGAAVAVHLAGLLQRRRGRGQVAFFGPEVGTPEASWLPAQRWEGVVVTDLLARTRPTGSCVPDTELPGFQRPRDGAAAASGNGDRVSFVGRREILRSIWHGIDVTDGRREPRLVTVLGASGLGKSRLLEELRDQVRQRAPDREVLMLEIRQPLASDTEQPLRQLLRLLLGDEDGHSDSDTARQQHERALGHQLGWQTWPGVAVMLGFDPPAQSTRAPGKLRHDVVRAIGHGLRRRARGRPLVLLLDDLHWADTVLLDAIELATSGDDQVPLAVVVTGDPRLLVGRPTWGERARQSERHTLDPLDEPAAHELVRALLRPVERPPVDVVKRIADRAHGNPRQLVELVRVLRREEIIRRYPGSNTWYVAADRLDEIASSASAQWLAARELESMPSELAELVRLCAILGPELSLDEVEGVQRNLIRDGLANDKVLEPTVGMTGLTQRGVLVATRGDRYRFRTGVLQEACYSLVADEAKRQLHEYAYRYWRALVGAVGLDRMYRLAHHGAAAGRADEAVIYYSSLAEAARDRHAYIEAESMFTRAIELSGPDHHAVRLTLLKERGGVRRRLTHYEDALADLEASREIAEARGDDLACIELLIEESAICDFTQDYSRAAELIERARELADAGLPPRVEARLRNWLGVARFHQHRDDESLALLTTAAALGETLGQHETQVGSLLMQGMLLIRLGRVDESLSVMDQLFELCEQAGDYFHLACALSNRVEVWRERGLTERATADLQRVIEVSREHGFAVIEAAGYANLAEHLYWSGDLEGAVEAARNAHEQSVRRFSHNPLVVTSLYYAQLLVHVGRLELGSEVLDSVVDRDLNDPSLNLMRTCVELALDRRPPGEWDAAIARGREHKLGLQLVELQWLRGRWAMRTGRAEEAAQVLDEAFGAARQSDSGMADLIAQDLATVRLAS